MAREELEAQIRALTEQLEEPEDGTTAMTVTLSRQMKAHVDKFAGNRRRTLADVTRRALAEYTGYALDEDEMRTVGRRHSYRNDEERKEAVKARQQQERAILRAAREMMKSNNPAAEALKAKLREEGVPALN